MTLYMVTGYDGQTISRTNSRDFLDCLDDIRGWNSKVDIPQEIIKKALSGPVFVYDLGCGQGNMARNLFRELGKISSENFGDPSLADRVSYIGIDENHSDTWQDTPRTRFIKANMAAGLYASDLPPMDVGIACWSLPYVNDKIAAIKGVNHKLSGDGIFIAAPFFSHQVKISRKEADLSRYFPNLEVQDASLVLNGSSRVRTELPSYVRPTKDRHDYGEKSITGHPGQVISHYKHA